MKYLWWLCWVWGVGIIVALPFAMTKSMDEQDRLMKQCMEDRKEYECKALLNGFQINVTQGHRD